MLIEARLFDAAIGDFPEHLDPLLKRIFQARGIVDSAALDRQLSCLPQPAKMQGYCSRRGATLSGLGCPAAGADCGRF